VTKGLNENEPNGRDIYPDIIDHPHWQSPSRHHMSLYDRAAQFAAFDALAGYSDMIAEEQRLVDNKIELGEEELQIINSKLALIADAIESHPRVTITYFVPDSFKAGGSYMTATEEIKMVDPVERKLVVMRTHGYGKLNVKIKIDNILDIRGELVDFVDEELE